MALTKEVSHDCQVLEDGQIQARTITRIMEDGVELSKTYHRHVIDVGDDLTDEVGIHKEVAEKVHTQARKDARDIVKAAQELKENGPPAPPPAPPSSNIAK